MTQYRRRLLWSGLSAAALLTACGEGEGEGSKDLPPPPGGLAAGEGEAGEGHAEGEGEGGEGGEGQAGEQGGEFGIDPKLAAQDPVAYLTALDVIRAHYLAGQAAFADGDTAAAAELFAHPYSEIYASLASVFQSRGVEDFGALLLDASDKVSDGADAVQVEQAIDAVFEALIMADQSAPESTASDGRIQASVVAGMIERAALQYGRAQTEPNNEPYLDGYGFYQAAKARAEFTDADLGDSAEAIGQALEKLGQAYVTSQKPDALDMDVGDLLAASSRVQLTLGS